MIKENLDLIVIEHLNFVNYNEFEKEIKKFIKEKPATYEVIINKLIWDNKINHDIYAKIYNDPITKMLVMPTSKNVWKAHEIYTYSIKNNKAKLI